MTEAEWLACTHPEPMLEFLRGKASFRKVLLFACSCCRRAMCLVPGTCLEELVAISENEAEGNATPAELLRAQKIAQSLLPKHPTYDPAGRGRMKGWSRLVEGLTRPYYRVDPMRAAMMITKQVADGFGELANDREAVREAAAEDILLVARYTYHASREAYWGEREVQSNLLRDLVGDPFRPTTIDSSWLRWNCGTVPHAAQLAYDERHLPSGELDRGRLGILADALEDAGCTNADILDHLRGSGPHVRGCFAIDLLLQKS